MASVNATSVGLAYKLASGPARQLAFLINNNKKKPWRGKYHNMLENFHEVKFSQIAFSQVFHE